MGLGAKYIEKHFTISKIKGPDHKASLVKSELKTLIQNIRILEKSFGNFKSSLLKVKNKILVRQSIHAREVIRKGDKFTLKNIMLKKAKL